MEILKKKSKKVDHKNQYISIYLDFRLVTGALDICRGGGVYKKLWEIHVIQKPNLFTKIRKCSRSSWLKGKFTKKEKEALICPMLEDSGFMSSSSDELRLNLT